MKRERQIRRHGGGRSPLSMTLVVLHGPRAPGRTRPRSSPWDGSPGTTTASSPRKQRASGRARRPSRSPASSATKGTSGTARRACCRARWTVPRTNSTAANRCAKTGKGTATRPRSIAEAPAAPSAPRAVTATARAGVGKTPHSKALHTALGSRSGKLSFGHALRRPCPLRTASKGGS